MAILLQDGGALRLVLRLLGRGGEPQPGAAAAWLASAGLEYRDQRDGEWWPLLPLPPFQLAAPAAEGLRAALLDLVRGAVPGFAWRAGEGADAPLALQLSAAEGGAVVEVGLDLGRFLAEAGGAAWRPGAELALLRFPATQAALVRFIDELGGELEAAPR